MSFKWIHKSYTAGELEKRLENQPQTIVVDLLPPDHYEGRHIPGARNACVFQVSFLKELAAAAPDKEALVVVYGASERSQDAAVALDKMERAGYQQIAFLQGGLAAWHEKGYALEGEATDQVVDRQTQVTLPDGHYSVDTKASRVEWAGRNPNTRHVGTVDITAGMLDLDAGKMTGEVEIDMNSIRNTNLEGDDSKPILEEHLRSDDFFFTQLFPKAVFSFKQAERIEPGWITAPNYHIKGVLNLRGVSADLEFDATVVLLDDHSLVLEAHFDIDRTRWNVIYGSARFFEHLGMHVVFDLLSFQIRLVANH